MMTNELRWELLEYAWFRIDLLDSRIKTVRKALCWSVLDDSAGMYFIKQSRVEQLELWQAFWYGVAFRFQGALKMSEANATHPLYPNYTTSKRLHAAHLHGYRVANQLIQTHNR